MPSTVIRNKRRGRAFQAKLAKMADGKNIGTLGGEDVEHIEFSYEAKTYHPKAPSHKGRPWVGEKLLHGLTKAYDDRFTSLKIDLDSGESLILLRWHWWEDLLSGKIKKYNIMVFSHYLKKFIGMTYMKQAEENCPGAKVPVVVVHTVGARHKNDIVILLSDYWSSVVDNYC